MEQFTDSLQTYKNILAEAFSEILKNLPKKYKDFRELVQKKQEEVSHEKEKKAINGNKYFIVLSMAIDTHIPRLCQQVIHSIEKLIAYKYMDGNCYDYTQDMATIDGEKKGQAPDPNRKLIEAIIDSICDCVKLKDENVHLQIIRSLLTIAISSTCQVTKFKIESTQLYLDSYLSYFSYQQYLPSPFKGYLQYFFKYNIINNLLCDNSFFKVGYFNFRDN